MQAAGRAALWFLLTLCLAPGRAGAQGVPICSFQLGFAALHAALPGVVGDCLEDAHYGPNGDALQRTTGGLLVWRKADNWTAFTDGYQTWVNGPYGLQRRLNTERFPWETAEAGPTPAPGGAAAVTVTEADDQKTVALALGQVLMVALRAAPGLQPWVITPPDPAVLAPVVDTAMPPVGVTAATYRAVGRGTADISAITRPACPPGAACPAFVRLFRVTVTVGG